MARRLRRRLRRRRGKECHGGNETQRRESKEAVARKGGAMEVWATRAGLRPAPTASRSGLASGLFFRLTYSCMGMYFGLCPELLRLRMRLMRWLSLGVGRS